MRIDTQKVGAVTVFEPHGPIIQDDAEVFGGRLDQTLRSSMGRLVLDVSGVPYLDSAGLEILADAAKSLQQTGQSLRLSGANETLRTVFDLTELAGMFDHYQDVNTAVRSFL
ncbi:STAS domain-containing protein [Algisphaera agarilytica]|uniref:Anti-sigma factor antagonist n=1 Tax=Algisphaera agarilytica TaxID=1385975 RepID=A0A7X0H7H2_9BACT|nr:STAS domain-containing protein [Algisphaera agarilytica]MBB6429249.1 anti-sigma B factor antagonist [Algisphaera agarilytica]